MLVYPLTGIEFLVFHRGTKAVQEHISDLKEYASEFSPTDLVRYTRYMEAADRYLQKSSKFIEFIIKNKQLIVFNILFGFVITYPKTKQNLVNTTELLNSVINYYVLTSKKLSKKYNPDNDPNLKFMKDNSANIYDLAVLITNLHRAKEMIHHYTKTHK
jgi:hypothetical protein